ncbi:hypothetical protein AWZ03_009012 [Drosophila navojoa]|uniref:Protein lava lamp n=1 Tax=Drosophila navojoa TaxID=7232 RepID=A0A484B701_DRONA|nr:protein lava lamp [Drosophila navojoa]TDG44606.1 hypothetical protein AWZ03_009012 [Drosophila navojoa]
MSGPMSEHMSPNEPEEESSSTDISLTQHVPAGGTGGKGRLDSLRENLIKQQERLTALRERALRKSEDGGRGKPSRSDSVESLQALGQRLSTLKVGNPDSPQMLLHELPAQDSSTPLVTPTKDVSGSEKLQMLNQRTEQNRALLEQRKRDMAKSLQSVKSGMRQSIDLGSSMSDLRAPATAAPVSRHWSAADLQLQLQQQMQQQLQQQPSEEGRLKQLKNKMRLIEMKQSRKEQELQQELNDLRNELTRREEQIKQLEATQAQQGERVDSQRLLQEQENARLHTEIEQLRERNAELENSSEMLEALRLELHSAREQLLEQQANQAAAEAAALVSTDAQVNVELAKQLQELEKELQELRDSKEEPTPKLEPNAIRVSELEAIIAQQSEQLAEKTTELNVLNVNLRVLEEKLAQSVKSKPLFLDEDASDGNEQLQAQLQQLKQKLDECNKSNIKLKLKCKQAEKQLQKMQSLDTQQELARITAENEQLQQRITVLEDEKGQWQLAHVEEDASQEQQQQQQSGKPAPTAGQTEAIRLLEEQKEELQQALEALQLGSETARVESELSEVQLEEQLSQRVQQLESEAIEQQKQLQKLQAEKEALDKKLTHYINENMELLDKLEKLSSSSSAESIEIVERPTARRFSQRPGSEGEAEVEGDQASGGNTKQPTAPAVLPSFVSELTQTDLAVPELEVNENLAQLRNESDELMQKIELFTNERREVLAKMEQLQAENAALQSQLKLAEEQLEAVKTTHESESKLIQEQLEAEKTTLQAELKLAKEQLQTESAALQAQLEELQRDKQQLSLQLSEKSNLSQELSSMQRSSEVVAALDCGEGGAALFDKCERSLSKLSSELEAYRKANDRNAKLNVSKKLAKEAKNVHVQLTELLQKVKEASTAVETVTVVETVVAVTAPNGKALAEYEQLTAQNAELKATLATLRAELEELRESYEPQEAGKQLAIGQVDEEEQQERAREREREQEKEREQDALIAELRARVEEEQQQVAQLESVIAELRAGEAEHLQLIASQNAELVQLKLQAERFDQSLNNSEMAHEKHMEQQQRLRRELQARIETLEGEQSILQALVAEQKQQLIESYSESEYATNMKRLELQQCQQELEASEQRNKELREKLKKYALSLKKRTAEQAELEQQLQRERATVAELQEQKQQLQEQQQQQQQLHDIDQLKEDNDRLNEQLAKQQSTLQEQQQQLLDRDQLKEDNDRLHEQLAKQQSKLSALSKLQEEVERLQVELQNTVHANTALRQESYKLEMALAEQGSVQELRRQLELKSVKFDKSKEVIKHRNATILSLQRELAELRAQLQAQPEEEAEQEKQKENAKQLEQLEQLRAQNAKMAEEKVNFEETIGRLETIHEGIQAKLQQDQSYIESLEAQIEELQSKCVTLEDQTASLRAHEASAKEQIELLEQQVREAHTQRAALESQLNERVKQLMEQELVQSRQIKMLRAEADESRELLVTLQATHETMLLRYKQEAQQAQAQRDHQTNNNEQHLLDLRTQLHARNMELEHQRQVFDAKLAAKATELDELECDLSAHMQRSAMQTRELTQQLERSEEQLQARTEELARLNDELAEVERERAALSREAVMLRMQQDSAEQDVLELQELRMQVIQDKTEMDNLRSQIDSLCANHNQELQALQQQIAELDTLGQNQTDDQVYIENENKRLTEQLVELQGRLDEQAEQLARQQAASAPIPAPPSFQSQATATDDWMAWSGMMQPTQRQEQNAPLPAPAMFFGGDAAAAPSPFDEIVAQPLRMTTQNLGMSLPQAQPVANVDSSGGEPTIEDLQRNVSDLEKHAKELETKLLARNQALAEHEERRAQLERLLAEREQELAQLHAAAEERERVAAVEALIQPAVAPTKAVPSLDMFFGKETVTDGAVTSLDLGLPQTEPVEEQLIIPKKAYICHPEQEQQQKIQQQQQQQPQLTSDWGVDVDEDPWANAGQEEQLTDATAALLTRIEELESQKAKLQTKTAKLMKCVKEYRIKEQQEQARNANNNDLDSAIMDELKNQLQLQEARQAKVEEQLQQQTLEKEKLLKRIDVLTAGNERMAELKERQDMDVHMYQTRIRELQDKLQQLESWGDGASAAATPTAQPGDEAAQARIENLMAENQDLNNECQELMAQLRQEKEQAQQERERLQAQLDAHNQEAEQLKKQIEQSQQEYQQLQQQLEELKTKQQECQQLQQQLEELKTKQLECQQLQQQLEELKAKEQECQQLQKQLEDLKAKQQEYQPLQQQLEELKSKQQECQQLQLQLDELRTNQLELPVAVSAPSDETMALLQEKESEIVHLKQRIEELMREDQTEKLVLEILTKNQELQMLRMQVKQLQEDKLELEQQNMPSKEQQDNRAESQFQQQLEQVQQELEQLRKQCAEHQREKNDMEEELRVLNNHVLSSLELEDKMKQTVLELDMKNIEITELRRTLEVLQQAQPQQQPQEQQQQQQQPDIAALNMQWEALVEQKCSEVARIWQEHLAKREAEYKAKIDELSAAAASSQPVQQEHQQQQTSPLPATENANEMLTKMQSALETQEMEIVTLKEQLAIRSAEYARLASQYDPFRLQNSLGSGPVAGASGTAGQDPQSEYVLRSDLDYALMMLHQRDMRVEEMIVELVQLLEERDHLQLKLSDTLRQLEAERTGGAAFASGSANATASSSTASSSSPNKLSGSGELAAATSASGSDLKQKLAELQTVKHSKDKAIVDEREQRLQQMMQLQRDMVKAAPTAAAPTTYLPSSPPAQQQQQLPQQQQQQQPLEIDSTQSAQRAPYGLMDWILGNNKNEDEAQQTPHNLPQSPVQQQISHSPHSSPSN